MSNLRIKIPKNKTDKVLDFYNMLENPNSNDVEIGTFLFLYFAKKEAFLKECYDYEYYILNYAIKMNNAYAVYILLNECDCSDWLETPDENDKTPLQLAIDNRNKQIITYLINKGAKMTVKTLGKLIDLKIY